MRTFMQSPFPVVSAFTPHWLGHDTITNNGVQHTQYCELSYGITPPSKTEQYTCVSSGEQRLLTRSCSVGVNAQESSNASPDWDGHKAAVMIPSRTTACSTPSTASFLMESLHRRKLNNTEQRLLTRSCSVGVNAQESSNASPDWDGHKDRVDQ
jgi:hypothetical protein